MSGITIQPAFSQVDLPSDGKNQAAAFSATEDLEALAARIESDQGREQMLREIRALMALQKQKGPSAPERPLSERLAEAATKTVAETSQTLAGVSRYFRNRQALEDWVRTEIFNPARLSRNAEKALPFVWIFGLAWLAEFLVGRLLAGLRNRVDERAQGSLAKRLPMSVAKAALRFCALTAFAVAGLAVFFVRQPGDAIGKVAFQVFAAYLTGRILMMLLRMVLAPSTPPLRLVPLSSESAHATFKWARRLVTVALAGYLTASIGILFGLPPRGFAAFMNLIGLIVTVMLVIVVLKNRAAVATWIRGAQTPSAPSAVGQSCRRSLAAVWHIAAIGWLLGLFIIWWQRIEGGFIYLMRSTLRSAVVVLIAWLLVKGLRRAAERILAAGDKPGRQPPSLRRRLISYVPPTVNIIRGAVILMAVLSLLEAWGLDAYSWLTTPDGRRILSASFSILLVVGIAVAIWEAVNIATERYLAETEKSGKTHGRSARIHTLLPLMRKGLWTRSPI